MSEYLTVLMLGKAVSVEMSARLAFPGHAPFPVGKSLTEGWGWGVGGLMSP